MAHYEPPHQEIRCLQIQLFAPLVVEELKMQIEWNSVDPDKTELHLKFLVAPTYYLLQ